MRGFVPRRSPTSLANQSRTNGWILDRVDALRTKERAVVWVGTDKPAKSRACPNRDPAGAASESRSGDPEAAHQRAAIRHRVRRPGGLKVGDTRCGLARDAGSSQPHKQSGSGCRGRSDRATRIMRVSGQARRVQRAS